MAKIYYKGRDYSRAIGGSGEGGGSVDSTDVPTAGKVSEFDSNAHINSEDMSAQDVEDFLADINAQGIPSEYRKLLWTNPSPTSAFAAQTISLDLSDCNEIEMLYAGKTTYADTTVDSWRFVVGKGGLLNMSANEIWWRYVTPTISGIEFGGGYRTPTYGANGVSDNTLIIPLNIYGIKYEKVAPIQVDASDYVIEQDVKTASDGTVWNCRKWNSGVAECWCKVLHTITGWTAWYSWYYSRPDTTKFSFPTDFFIDVPIVEASRSSGIAGVLCEEGAPSAIQTQQYYLIRPDAPAANGFNLDIHAIGKWK